MAAIPQLCDGVYLNLPEPIYFGQRGRRGSTDLKVLAGPSPADWWYGCKETNPDHIEAKSPERDFGHALHVCTLEGDVAFISKITIRPETYPDPTTGAAKNWNGNATYCKNWLAERKGDCIITLEAEGRVRHMAALIRNHPDFKDSLALDQGLSEVTVLFHLHGVACRARIDRLLPQFVVDLKSYGGHTRGFDPHDKALRIIAERSYDIQRYLYDRAREYLATFIRQGLVWDYQADQGLLTPEPKWVDWLNRLAAEPEWSWVWIFYQRRDDRAGRAPVVVPIEVPHLDVTFDTGRQKVELAMSRYRDFVGRFGLDNPWATIEPMWRPQNHDFPPWLSNIAAHANDNGEDTVEDDAA